MIAQVISPPCWHHQRKAREERMEGVKEVAEGVEYGQIEVVAMDG